MFKKKLLDLKKNFVRGVIRITKIQKLIDASEKKVNKKIDHIVEKNKKLAKTVRRLHQWRHEKDTAYTHLLKTVEEQDLAIINNQLISQQCENLVITTYPKFASRNVGDAMITASFIKLMKDLNKSFECIIVFREVSLDKLDLKFIKNIYLPGMCVGPGTYPNLYTLFNNLDEIDKYKFFPVSCSFRNPGHEWDRELAYQVEFSKNDYNFFHKIIKSTGPILCRDFKISETLSTKGIDSKFFGDLVFFDSDYTNRSQIPKKISHIAFSVAHSAKFNEQAIILLSKLRALFNEQVKIYVTFHSRPNAVTINFEKNTSNLGNIEYVDLSGDADNLDFYNNIDLHIGYRLHGHISFLRRRKPSILMAEDVRAYGFYKTNELNYGIFDALDSKNLIEKVWIFLKEQMNDGFEGYEVIFKEIDKLYENVVIASLK